MNYKTNVKVGGKKTNINLSIEVDFIQTINYYYALFFFI